MLIEALLIAFADIIDLLLLPFQMEAMPEQIELAVLSFIEYIASACGVIATYTHFAYLLVLLGLVIVIDALHTAYIVLMWILRKIPLLNIS